MSIGVKLNGDLELAETDVSTQATQFSIVASADEIELPPTFGSRKTFRKGADMYEITVSYWNSDGVSATDIENMFWDAIADGDGTIAYSGSPYVPTTLGASYAKYAGIFVVTGAEVGGEAEQAGTRSMTFKCTDRPTKTIEVVSV